MQPFRDFYQNLLIETEKKAGIGTFLGVYLPSLCTMIGSIVFLHLGVILGNTGLFQTFLILLLSLAITLVTSLSLASVASNMNVGGGGTYFMISRSFGLEIGASIGIALYIAHTLMLCLCVFGFSHQVAPLLFGIDEKALSFLLLAFLGASALYSTDFAVKSQIGVFVGVLFSLLILLFGHYRPFEGPVSHYYPNFSFWSVFALLYPCLTGIEAGAAMSGDLKKPKFSLIFGTISVALSGFLFYIGLFLLLYWKVPEIYLMKDRDVLVHIAGKSYLLIGLWLAALSSALGCMLSAPRTLKAMAKDGLFPKWLDDREANGSGPRMATSVTIAFAILLITFGNIGCVVPYLTMVLLIVYGMLNLSSGIEGLIGNPSWRPTLHISPYISLLGAFLCLFAIIMMDAGKGLIAIFFVLALYTSLKKRNLHGKMDDLRQTMLYFLARYSIYRLAFAKKSLRSWRPNFLVLSESGSTESPILTLSNYMASGSGFLTLASVLKREEVSVDEIERWEEAIRKNLQKKEIEALVEVTSAKNLADGLKNIITSYGLGPLTPNTVVLGQCVRRELLDNYLHIVEIASIAKKNVLIFRGALEALEPGIKEIDIWWDHRRKKNSDLMLILADLMIRTRHWYGAKICLKSVVLSHQAQESQQESFEEFLQKSRLRISTKIYLAENEDSIREVISSSSTKNGIVFLGIKDPTTLSEEEYKNYYLSLIEDFKEISVTCFTICKEDVDLRTILT